MSLRGIAVAIGAMIDAAIVPGQGHLIEARGKANSRDGGMMVAEIGRGSAALVVSQSQASVACRKRGHKNPKMWIHY